MNTDLSAALTPTIFHEPWWLANVTNGTHREALAYSGNRLVGRLPFVASRRLGMTLVQMPMFTHFLGPAIDPGFGAESTRFMMRLSITKSLIRQLPPASHLYIKHHRGTADTIAFQMLGFETDVQFTREIAPAPTDVLWRQMRDKTRNVIRRAEERFDVIELDGRGTFAALYSTHLREKRLANYYDVAAGDRLIAACLERGVGRVLAARDRDGTVKAAIFTVWDATMEYYLLSTRSAAAGNGAISLLVWHAMQAASRRGAIFDFDGVRGPGDAQFFSGFGGVTAPRYISYRNARAFKLASRIWKPPR